MSKLNMKTINDNQQKKNGSKSFHFIPWSSVPSEMHITIDEVHVWCLNLNNLEVDINSLELNLSEYENVKANAFHFKNDRENYIGRHVMLRKLLSKYLSLEPDKIAFSYSFHGKPYLSNYSEGEKIHFNLSHSKGLVLCAMTRGREIGIDVEKIIPGIMDDQFISYVFSQKELTNIQSLPPDLKTTELFKLWTRKEAFAKALGHGLSFDLKQIDVSNALFERSTILKRYNYAHKIRIWSLRDLKLCSGYAGSIVVEGYNWALKCWKLGCDFN